MAGLKPSAETSTRTVAVPFVIFTRFTILPTRPPAVQGTQAFVVLFIAQETGKVHGLVFIIGKILLEDLCRFLPEAWTKEGASGIMPLVSDTVKSNGKSERKEPA